MCVCVCVCVCNIAMRRICEIYICSYNVHTYRNPRNKRNTDDSLGSGTKHLLPFKFKFFDTWRERHNFSMLTVRPSSALNSLTQPMRVRTSQSTNWTGLAQVRKINSLRLSPNLNSLLLFKITKNPSPSLPGMMSFTSPALFTILVFYCDICDCHILPAHA